MHKVKCYYCGQQFDADAEPFVKVNARRYAHQKCVENPPKREDLALCEYIEQLFNTDYVYPNIQKQIKDYMQEYNFTYNGILNALKYWYEVRKNPINREMATIGIVPYIYKQAQDFYFFMKQAEMLNESKTAEECITKQKVIEIESPRVENIKPKLFDLDDNEESYNKEILAQFDDGEEGFNI